jgi:hypothetical protein
MHIAVRASNRIEVLLLNAGATAIMAKRHPVAAQRRLLGERGLAATMARKRPTARMARFTYW